MHKPATDWDTCQIVAIAPPPVAHCPECGRAGHTIVRSVTSADRSVTRRVVCKRCSHPYIVLVSPELASDWQGD